MKRNLFTLGFVLITVLAFGQESKKLDTTKEISLNTKNTKNSVLIESKNYRQTTIKVYDAQRNLVLEKKPDSEKYEFNTTELTKGGVYLIKVEENNEVVKTLKYVKK